ncbi:MAG: carbamoyltransferase HypF [Butyrivibrio sp.]|nr:carbamoyltransferase HypF [Butyrivibrio sp.]MBR1642492.1 carbamoyltransferase HypF [Butyrivibrio sp.]
MIKEILVKGAVQGVGYRPFIAFKAEELNISGFVKNIGAAVMILAIGPEEKLEALISYIKTNTPAGSFILDIQVKDHDHIPDPYKEYELSFSIIDSTDLDLSSDIPVFLPDIGICDDCKKELLETKGRRYRYYLNSCAVCGPRISILKALPYDRQNTTMGRFRPCMDCDNEYKIGRRRYAQGLSCSNCGPSIRFSYKKGKHSFEDNGEKAVDTAIEILKEDGIIGLKGVAGYQLVCKPTRENAIRLRSIKHRENKPFAIMFFDENMVNEYAYMSDPEKELLKSEARPIVLLKKRYDFDDEIVKGSRYIGAFLPSAGIHLLLTKELGPLIVTSANSSDDPIIIEDDKFMASFIDVADDKMIGVDGVLYHDLQINMPMDDSVAFVISDSFGDKSQFIRRSRGYVPLPVLLDDNKKTISKNRVVLAFGGDLKSTFAIGHNDKVLLSQQIGDLEDYACQLNYKKLQDQYADLFKQIPDVYVCDLHPLYYSSQIAMEMAEKNKCKLLKLQHHFAHIYSVMAENSLESTIGLAFDGTGYGTDGSIWGGEFLYCNGTSMERMGHLSYVTMVGGDNASKNALQTRKCYEHRALLQGFIDKATSLNEKSDAILHAALNDQKLCYNSSSMGRLFDATASLLGTGDYNSYEGECAINLEKLAWEFENKKSDQCPDLKFDIKMTEDGFIADQTKLFCDVLKCTMAKEYDASSIAYGFHMAIVDMIVRVSVLLRDKTNEEKVCLSGGVFNNRLILTKAIKALLNENFKVFWNQKVPLGDGGISLGQAYFGLMYEKE